jgi:pre-mRNA-splicing factor ATP-dependent RNA helicase DHX38/PRP16
MQCATVVDPHWLAEMGPVFFSIREGGQTRAEKRKKEREHKERMEAEHQTKLEIERLEAEKKKLEMMAKCKVVEVGEVGGGKGLVPGKVSKGRPKKKRRVGM